MRKTLPSQIVKYAIKFTFPFLAFIGMANLAEAQTAYSYRTKQSGSWNDINSWQRLDGTWKSITDPVDLPDATAGTISILSNHTITVTANQSADQLTVNGTLTVNNGVILDISDDGSSANDLVINGILINAGNVVPAINAKILINATGIYKHNHTTTFGSIPTATWNATSILEFIGYTNPVGTPVGFNQSFGNVIWNTSNATADINLNGALASTIRGDLTISSTNGKSLNLVNNTSYALTVNGNLNVLNNSILNISDGTLAGATFALTLKGALNVSGNATFMNANAVSPATISFTGSACTLTNTGTLDTENMSITVANVGVLTLNSPVTIAASQTFLVLGELNIGSNIISGAGNFEVNIGTLRIGSQDGITSSPTQSGNIQVTGTRSFKVNSTYIYNGTAAQQTGNGLPGQVAGLTVNNISGLSLTRNLIINFELKLVEGILNTTGKTLTVSNTATLALPSPDKISFIEGALSQTVSPASEIELYFPVGNGGVYRPVSLNLLFSTLPSGPVTYTTEQINGAYPVTQSFPGSIDRISSARYFKVSQAPLTPILEGMISLTYGSDDGVTDMNTLSIAQPSGSGEWLDMDGTVNFGSTTTAGTIVTMFTDFSDFVLANKSGGSNPLPVELVSFSAKNQESKVVLDWATASEKNNARFEVERSSNGVNFYRIAQVEGAGTTSIAQNYRNTDIAPLAGLAYYRLKQVDFNGSFEYSKIVTVTSQSGKNPVVLYPNPTAGNLTLAAGKGAAQIRILNVLGQQVYQATVKDATSANFDLNHLPGGTYQLVVEKGGEKIVSKFMKTNR